MRAKEILELLEGLATYFTLAASDAGKEQYKESRLDASGRLAAFYEGKKQALDAAFNRVGGIIKKARR